MDSLNPDDRKKLTEELLSSRSAYFLGGGIFIKGDELQYFGDSTNKLRLSRGYSLDSVSIHMTFMIQETVYLDLVICFFVLFSLLFYLAIRKFQYL